MVDRTVYHQEMIQVLIVINKQNKYKSYYLFQNQKQN